MPRTPSAPKLPPMPKPNPKPQQAVLEQVNANELINMRKRKGFMSTMITRGALGAANINKARALGT